MSELIKKLEAFRANLVGEDMNYRACLVDEAIERIEQLEADYDPTPWCSGCGARKKSDCHCGPIAENE